jgi:hypothetical protein
MIHIFTLSFIPGVMVGFEWDYINKFVIVDLFIVRWIWDYYDYEDFPDAV